MAEIVTAYIIMAYIIMVYIVMAFMVMAHVDIGYAVMAYIVMAIACRKPKSTGPGTHTSEDPGCGRIARASGRSNPRASLSA